MTTDLSIGDDISAGWSLCRVQVYTVGYRHTGDQRMCMRPYCWHCTDGVCCLITRPPAVVTCMHTIIKHSEGGREERSGR